FLLPLWSLSFATEAIGGERENRSLIWMLTRPLPRWAMYLARWVALLPWAIGLNLGGFALLCLAAGPPGQLALGLYWPAVLWASLAFASLFLLIGAIFPRPGIVAILYSFCLEMVMGNMPGYLKRLSVSFYARCLMLDRANDYGVETEQAAAFLPVSSHEALATLLAASVLLLVLGMFLFTRAEYSEGDGA
ncbi:MAG: ABC transporter permease subunit, partial [Gemmataceae bacterium]